MARSFRRIIVVAAASVLAGAGWGLAQDATRINVTDTVIRKASELEPLGLNNFGEPGGTKHAAGNLIFDPGFEPVTMRDLYRVIDSGEEGGRHWVTLDGPGTSNYALYTSGTYSGADMRAYRFLDAEGKPLPYQDAGWAQGGKVLNTAQGAQCVPLFRTKVAPRSAELPAGGWTAPNVPDSFKDWSAIPKSEQEKIAQGWRVYYEGGQPLRMDDVVMFERSFAWPEPEDFHPRTRDGGKVRSHWTVLNGSRRHIPLPSDAPAEMDGGRGAMELTPADGVAQVWNKMFGGPGRDDARWYSTLEAGLTYRYEAWVKRSGGTGGKLLLAFGESREGPPRGYFGNPIQQEYDIGEQWQRVGFEFQAPEAPAQGGIEGAVLRYTGDGKLLVDNVKLQPVYQPGDADKPFVINQKLLNTLVDSQPPTGRKGAVRIWAGLSYGTMEALCSWVPDNAIKLGSWISAQANQSVTVAKALAILEASGDSPETRCVPWIMTQITHTEEEYLQLVEYLAAPYDAATDTPQTKPMAYKRFQQRGHGRPWTSDFREIIIEYGNENWHNRAHEGWIGLGRRGTVHQAGREYGLWSKYMTEQMRQSPYWDDKQLKICLGGNYSASVKADGSVGGYGQEATVAAGGVNRYHSHATYIGPRWETGEASQTSIDDIGVRKTLLAYRTDKDREWEMQAKAHQRMREMGLDVRMSAYEGGPSGFGFRAKSPEQDRAGEYYGKSRAMGTAMLDAWLDAWKKGWTYQCYLTFGQGRWWSSHTSYAHGFRPSPGFLSLVLVNRTLANLDMVDVKVSQSPAKELELPRSQADVRQNKPAAKRSVDMIHAHAAMGEGKAAVAVVNLDLDAAHKVQLDLPFATARSITMHSMTGDPRDTNLDDLKVELKQETLDASSLANGSLTLQVEAGGAIVLEFTK